MVDYQPDVVESKFTPLPKQKRFMLSTEGQTLLSGSFGAGKSRSGCEKGYYLNCKYPGNRGLIIRKSLKDVKASTIEQTLLGDTPPVIPKSHIVKHTVRDCKIVHRTGTFDPSGEEVLSEIHYYGMESGRGARDDDLPEKIGSTSWGWIFVDEGTELEKGEWVQLLGRLRYKGKEQNGYRFNIPFRPIFTATNPDSPAHWMYDYFKPDDPGEGEGEVIKMSLDDNPHLPEDYVQRLKSSVSGMFYERYIEGEWVGAEGMVYSQYDPRKHVIQPEDLEDWGWEFHGTERWETLEGDDDFGHFVTPPEDWEVYRSFDFGYRNPFVCQWWAVEPGMPDRSKCVLFREIYQSEKLISDHAPRIKALSSNLEIADSIADHDAENIEELRRHEIYTQRADKDVEVGIQSVMNKLEPDAEGNPQLFFMEGARVHKPDQRMAMENDPLCTLDEIASYKWEEEDEEPVKEDDHGMDAMRYFCHTIFGGPVLSTDEMEEWEDTFNNDDWSNSAW